MNRAYIIIFSLILLLPASAMQAAEEKGRQLHLFSTKELDLPTARLLTFMERYLWELSNSEKQTSTRMMKADRTKIEKGRISDISTITPKDIFSMDIADGRCKAKWSRNEKEFFVFSFPMEYELISGLDKTELENGFETEVQSFRAKPSVRKPVTLAQLKSTLQKEFFILKGNTYLDKRLNSDLYYQKCKNYFTLVRDITFPAESCANMMLTSETDGDFTLDITQILYGFKQKQFSMPLHRWIDFCQANGCTLYFGIEKIEDTEIQASVIAQNEMEGYAHVVFVKIPLKVIDDSKGNIWTQLHSYVPMHNVQTLFDTYKKRNKKREYEN